MFTFSANSQNVEWYFVGGALNSGITNVEDLSDNEVFYLRPSSFMGERKNFVSKYFIDEDIIKEVEYSYQHFSTYVEYSILNENSKTILTFANLADQTDSIYTLITEWDYDLNILQENKYYVGKDFIFQYQGQWTGEDEIVVVGSYGKDTLNSRPVGNIYFKLNGVGEVSLITYESIDNYIFHAHDICKRLSGVGYISGGTVFRYIDDSLKVISSNLTRLGQAPGNQFSLRQWSDTSYIFAGTGFDLENPLGTDALILCEFNDSLEILKSKTFGYTHDIGFPYKCLDWQNTNNMYVGGFSYPLLGTGIIKLYNFDKNLNLRWQQEYKIEEEFKYYGYKLVATMDGGCIIGGSVIRSDSEKYPFMMKISNDHVGTNNLPDIISQITTLYPNPSTNDLRIDIRGITEVDMTIYDLQGRRLLNRQGLIEGVNTFDDLELEHGIYIVKLEKDGEIVSSQQWVKK